MAELNRIISIDDHVQETPDLWTSRISGRFGDRAPRLVSQGGRDVWVVDGQELLGGRVCAAGGFLSDRTAHPDTWDTVPSAAYAPADRLKAMDAGGIDRSILFPTVGGFAGEAFGVLDDPDLELACVQAYNDWLIEEWAGASDRFVPQCMVPLGPPDVRLMMRPHFAPRSA